LPGSAFVEAGSALVAVRGRDEGDLAIGPPVITRDTHLCCTVPLGLLTGSAERDYVDTLALQPADPRVLVQLTATVPREVLATNVLGNAARRVAVVVGVVSLSGASEAGDERTCQKQRPKKGEDGSIHMVTFEGSSDASVGG
jgi:hypothetical protein